MNYVVVRRREDGLFVWYTYDSKDKNWGFAMNEPPTRPTYNTLATLIKTDALPSHNPALWLLTDTTLHIAPKRTVIITGPLNELFPLLEVYARMLW